MTSSTRHAFVPFANGGSKPLLLDREKKNENSNDERSQLIELFQTYADLYPNPRLIEEHRMRDTLLQAASAANVASEREKQKETSRGFFSRWWFGSDDGLKDDLSAGNWNTNATNEDPLVYLDMEDDNYAEDEILCGTMHGLDLDCIPTEVYSLARFHLASTRTRLDTANVLRQGVAFSSSTQSLVVVGLGEIAELSTQQEPFLSTTSDRDMLLAYSEKENFTLAYVRATAIADNCIAVSWGFLDGIITIYRRVKIADSSLRWEVVWILGPSNGVLENLRGREFFHDDEFHPGSELLRVSDCLPLSIETGYESEPTVITLAVARLGGYIELIPLPQGVWNAVAREQGTRITPKFGLRGTVAHYTSGHKIQSPPNTLALTTAQCHIDVLSLQALRTTVDANSTWDVDTFPDSPPSEYIICASGMNENGIEVISFWATSIVFSEAHDRRCGIATELHSSLIEAISVETGADVSLFATTGIMKRWRKPRSVAIRENFNLESASTGSKSNSASPDRVTTLTFTAPIVKIEFNVNNILEHGAWLAAMDWNGGVVISDCSLIGRLASQSLSTEELHVYQNAENSASLVKRIATRKQLVNILQKTSLGSLTDRKQQSTIEVCDIKWVENANRPCLILLVKILENTAVVALSTKLSLLFAALTARGERIKLLGTNELSFIAKKNGKERNILRHFALQDVRSQGTENAAGTAASPQGTKSTNLLNNQQSSLAMIWPENRAIDTIEANQDPSIVVPEVLSIILHGCWRRMTIESLRIICHHAIFLGRHVNDLKEQVQEIASFLVKLGTFQLLCQHLSSVPSLTRFRAKFQNSSLASIAETFAARSDLSALTIIIYRHRFTLDECMKVLERLPLSTNPTSFAHLVPMLRKGSIAPSFLLIDDENKIETANWSHMPVFARGTFGVQLVLDEDDGESVLDVFLNQVAKVGSAGVLGFRLWLRARTVLMQSFIGNVKHTVLLFTLGIRCETLEEENKREEVTEIVLSHHRHSILLSFIIEVGEFLVDGAIANESGSDDLISMKEQEIVEIALERVKQPAEVVDKCLRFLRPFAVGMTYEVADCDLDEAISSFCIQLVERSCASPLKKTDINLWFQLFASSTSICGRIAEESRTSKPRESRVIRQKMELLRMVKSILLVAARTLNDLNVSPESCKMLINTFWQLCETLPAPIPASFPTICEHAYFEDVLFCTNALMGFEILSQWPGCNPRSFLAQFCRLKHVPDRNAEDFGMHFVIKMLWSYCAQIKEGIPHEALAELIDDLLEDAMTINIFCFRGSIDIPLVLTKQLIPHLLEMEAFDVIFILLARHPKSIDCVGAELAMQKFLEDAMFLDGEASVRKIARFRDHANTIKSKFPNVFQVLDQLDRCAKASHFVNSSIFKGARDVEPMVPTTLKHVLPLDLIDCILEAVPESVVYKLHERQRMQDGIQETTTNKEIDGFLVPVGDAILYLASILGCNDDCSRATVICKVVQVSIKEGCREEAVMLCQNMINEWKRKGTYDYAAAGGIWDAIHVISMDESSMNVVATRELYQHFLREIYCSVRLPFSSSVLSILAQSASMDFQYICGSSDEQCGRSRVQEILLLPSLIVDRSLFLDHQSRLKMLLFDLHQLVAVGKMQDSAIFSVCADLIERHTSNSKPLYGILERYFPSHLLFFFCTLVLHISGSVQLIALLCDSIDNLNAPSHHNSEDGERAMSGFSSAADMAENSAESIHRLRKVLKFVESHSINDSGAGQSYAELLHLQNPHIYTTTDFRSRPENPAGKGALNESKWETTNSSSFCNVVRLHQNVYNDVKVRAESPSQTEVRKTSHIPGMIQVEHLDCQKTVAIASNQNTLTSRMLETRQRQLCERASHSGHGSSRGRLIEEGRLLLLKTRRKKRSESPFMSGKVL